MLILNKILLITILYFSKNIEKYKIDLLCFKKILNLFNYKINFGKSFYIQHTQNLCVGILKNS